MMNQGGHAVSELDHTSTQNHQLGGIQQPTNVYVSYPPPAASPWSNQRIDNTTTENGVPSGSGYSYNPHSEHVGFTSSKDVQQTVGAPSHSSTPGVGNAAQYGYAPYTTSSDPYGHGAAGYQGQSYYYGYDQQSNLSYPQHSGAYQTSGAPYQTHTSSFQDSQPSSYTGAYYNTGDYQTTTSGYQTGGYPGQANYWNDGSYGSYPHYYSSYTSFDSNSAHSSSSASVAPLQYQQQYKQWADYYSQSTDVTCAPGTENIPVTSSASASSSSSVQCEIAGTNGGYYSASCSQPPPPGTSSWQPDPCASELPMQEPDKLGSNYDGAWSNMSPGFSEDVASYGKSSLEPASLHDNYNSQLAIAPLTQATAPQYSAHQYAQNFQAPSQSVPSVETGSMTKLQIPTNPRIVSNLPVSLPKTNKDAIPTDTLSKPSYISVAIPKHSRQATSADVSDPMLKQQFPASLRAYVERALARCKDDIQKTACQNSLKEIITKASTDGTLFTRNWDVEPLFPLPAVESASSIPQVSVMPKFKRSPSRRSRWEPLPEEKVVEKPLSINYDPIRDVGGGNLNLRERMGNNGRLESKFQGNSQSKSFLSPDKNYQDKSEQRLVKKARLADAMNGAIENGDASNDGEEQSLTAYYAAAINLANSPEERKKRESRFKRFDKDQESKSFRAKGVGPGNLYAKWANASLDSKKREEGSSRAVEDMDWDSLTVKGTCQDIEKRYLRLTSAPDPASVRPEEVLEKALLMVQNSQKNYLYKCDQLKSIRQDLTVQRIHNELTVKVYETHARLALGAGDLPEYNQCQSQLKILYSEGIKGCHMEFAAYNLLCVILHSNNNRELLSSMARLSADAKRDEAVKHALAVRAAVTSGNYVLFFRLYKTAPNLNTCLMDLYVEKMRFEAVKCMSRSYRPSVPVVYIAQVLGFPSLSSPEVSESKSTISSSRVEDCIEWLRTHGANLNEDSNGEMQLDTKASSLTLYMPEPEDAVAHGDANLAVIDFLTRTL